MRTNTGTFIDEVFQPLNCMHGYDTFRRFASEEEGMLAPGTSIIPLGGFVLVPDTDTLTIGDKGVVYLSLYPQLYGGHAYVGDIEFTVRNSSAPRIKEFEMMTESDCDVFIDNRAVRPGKSFQLKGRIKEWKSATIPEGPLEVDVEI